MMASSHAAMTFAPVLFASTGIEGEGGRLHSASSLYFFNHLWTSSTKVFGLFLHDTSCFIGQPLALGALEGAGRARGVVNAKGDPVVMAKIEFAEVPVQVGLGDVLVDADEAALEDAEISLDAVGVDDAAN